VLATSSLQGWQPLATRVGSPVSSHQGLAATGNRALELSERGPRTRATESRPLQPAWCVCYVLPPPTLRPNANQVTSCLNPHESPRVLNIDDFSDKRFQNSQQVHSTMHDQRNAESSYTAFTWPIESDHSVQVESK
jgi:hypothetical protein